ncbi:hypothetical protein [Roseomonas sp. HF4]|uniref:hypothetical protein n=1 Tax=Roseomonas sp. HF4 TaxID=2562313 RepID=UPI0010C1448B|nr:hypothetical protein [Roseomonas sp. HF4]
MIRHRPVAAVLLAAALLAGAGARAQAPELSPPRVIYGTPSPSVVYGQPSTPPEATRRQAQPQQAPPPPPQGSLTFESGPAYLPPAYWLPRQDGRHWRQRWPDRPPPPTPTPYVSPRGGMFEPPLPQGRYVGQPPGAPPQPRYGRQPFP